MKNKTTKDQRGAELSLPTIEDIKLEPIYGSTYCQYSVIEQKLATLYQNQEKILQAIKILNNKNHHK